MNNNSEIKTNMKPEEALKLLNDMEFAEQYQGVDKYTDMLLVCKEALNRSTAVRPDYWGDGYDDEGNLIYDQAKCPECGHDFEYNINDWGSPFCPDCGKALDWSEYEEEAEEEEVINYTYEEVLEILQNCFSQPVDSCENCSKCKLANYCDANTPLVLAKDSISQLLAEKKLIMKVLIQLLYDLRTNMTSVTRYVKYNRVDHSNLTAAEFSARYENYQQLANTAVDNILKSLNDNIELNEVLNSNLNTISKKTSEV